MFRQLGISSILFSAIVLFSAHALAQESVPGSACAVAGQLRQSGGVELSGAGHMMVCNGGVWTSIFSHTADGSFMQSGAVAYAGIVSPATIGGNQNNYNPAGIATASVLRLTASAAYNITGLAGGTSGRLINIINIGSQNITLVNESGSSTIANRFAIGTNIVIGPSQGAILIYDGASSRWRVMAGYGSGGGSPGGADRQIQFNNAGAFGGVPSLLYNANGTVSFESTYTGTANETLRNTYFRALVAPSAAQTSGRRTAGVFGEVSVPGTNSNSVHSIVGTYGNVENYGTGSISTMWGALNYGYNWQGTIGTLAGSYSGVMAAGTSNVGALMGVAAGTSVTGGTVTSIYGVHVDSEITGGSVTTRYGIYVANPTGSATNDYGIWQQGTQANRLSGRLGVGTTPSADRMLDVSSTGGTTGLFYNNGTTGMALYASADNTAAGTRYGVYAHAAGGASYGLYCQSVSNANGCGGNRAWFNASDLRLKKDIQDLPAASGLDAIMKLRPVTYRWRDPENSAVIDELGFIAQEVEAIFPAIVGQNGPDVTIRHEDGSVEEVESSKSISYATVVVPLVKAVQELKEENDNLRAEISALRSMVDALVAND